jgi:CheY-like chemotaxis protein
MERTVLLVEDDSDTQFLFVECLQAEGLKAHAVSHCQEALDYVSAHGMPAVVVLDLTLPFMTPEEFVTKLRALPGGSEVPVLITSGKAELEEYRQRLSAKTALKKPYDLDELIRLIRSCL